jgi:hypothetical protein
MRKKEEKERIRAFFFHGVVLESFYLFFSFVQDSPHAKEKFVVC